MARQFGLVLGPKEPVRKELTRLNSFLSGVEEGVRPKRTETCLRSTEEHLEGLLAHFYIQKAFSDDAKRKAETTMHAIIQAFDDRLSELDWLDGEVRAKAKAKAAAITVQIGYPLSPPTNDSEALERYYSLQQPFNATDHFGNVLRSVSASERRFWLKIGRPMDLGEWGLKAFEVNAEFNPTANAISFPAGILQPPYFSLCVFENYFLR